jgi:hypothetical protein
VTPQRAMGRKRRHVFCEDEWERRWLTDKSKRDAMRRKLRPPRASLGEARRRRSFMYSAGYAPRRSEDA